MTPFRRFAASALVTVATAGTLALVAPAAQAAPSCSELQRAYSRAQVDHRRANNTANYHHTQAQRTSGATQDYHELRRGAFRAQARAIANLRKATYRQLDAQGCI